MKTWILVCVSFLSLHAHCQNKDEFYPMDESWKPTSLDSGTYFIWLHQLDNGNWQWSYYNIWGPLIKTETFADKQGTILNGRFCIYNVTGNMDSLGNFDHGNKQGSFYKLRTFRDDSIRYVMEYIYDKDSLIKTIDLLAEDKKKADHDSSKEIESQYPGGIKKWGAYLSNKLAYPQRAMNRDIQGQVGVNFVVDENGKVLEAMVSKSREWSLDQEAILIIQNSGKWIPASKDGVPVKSYKFQPINFRLTN